VRRWRRYLELGALMTALVAFAAACGESPRSGSDSEPVVVEHSAGTKTSRVTLSAEAAGRLRVRTAVAEQSGSDTVIPYAAVVYSATGKTWTYVTTKALTYERQAIVVERIDGDRAFLTAGPSPGSRVAIAGVMELVGAEGGIDR